MGADFLSRFPDISALVRAVTLEHHERADGSGYPRKLGGDQVDPISRIAAVLDSFDAMTAVRPFKEKTLTTVAAMQVLADEAPLKYDLAVVAALARLLGEGENPSDAAESEGQWASCKRDFERYRLNCPARLHVLEAHLNDWRERPGLHTMLHSISRSGLGMLSEKPVPPGEHVRVYLLGESNAGQASDGITARCREYRDGWFEVGVKYDKLAPPGDAECIAVLTSAL
jgi:hypothetical protein